MISPNFDVSKLDGPSFDDLVDVFEDRVKYWLLKPARNLVEDDTGQVAGFCLSLTYFEGFWSYYQGQDSRGRSQEFFKKGFGDVFRHVGMSEDLSGRIAVVLYEDARCGFFHDGLFRERIFFARMPGNSLLVTLPKSGGVIDESGEIQSVLVNPDGFLADIDRHSADFVSTLRGSAEDALRSRFQAFCQSKWDYEGEPRVIGIDDPDAAKT